MTRQLVFRWNSLWLIAGALAAAVLLTLPLAAPAAPKVRSDETPPCPVSTASADDLLLRGLSTRDKNLSRSQQLPWGEPKPTAPTTHETTMVRRDYIERYDSDLRVPIWTAQHVEFAKLDPKKFVRLNCFRPDPKLEPADASTPADYDEPIFDQGHMTPNADMAVSQEAVLNSFVMSNMAPQFCQFNRGTWQILESLGREWSKEEGTVYIFSGSVFDRDGDGVRDPDTSAIRMTSKDGLRRVAVPTAFYKIIAYRKSDGTVASLAVLLPHDQYEPDLDNSDPTMSGSEKEIDYLSKHVVPISTIERLTGLDLFPDAKKPFDEASTLWPFQGKTPSSLAHSPQCKSTKGARLVGDTYKLH